MVARTGRQPPEGTWPPLPKGHANFDMVTFVRAHTGPGGKVAAAMALQCNDVIDDRDDICKEALAKGLGAWPIQTKDKSHAWTNKGFLNFAEAVEELLKGKK